MAEEDLTQTNEEPNNEEEENSDEDSEPEPEQQGEEEEESSSSSSSSDSDSDSDSSDSDRESNSAEDDLDDDSPESNVKQFAAVLDSKRMRKKEEQEDREYVFEEDLFDFPKDPEKWKEQDLQELWEDAPVTMKKPGWDPVWADDEDWEAVMDDVEEGKDPPIAPFYLPYRKPYPAIPDNHFDIATPKAVVEELDRIEEFLTWVSYIFPDGTSYEGTVWDDLAHGKGVYVAEQGLVRYEGEWLQNNMEGHGVVEVDIPDVEPVPGSALEEKMRAQGRIIKRDYMTPEDREWLEMDIEDSYKLSGGWREIPFYENNEWVRLFGEKPEKGRYRYAGQWKHGRMHGCGVYEVNESPIIGRFYFGELVEEDIGGCDEDTSMLHAGIAEVAAAKARMFVNKPDGMVREQRGPYSDPQHPYMYEEEDVWMAPGFIHQFHEVPDDWKTYVHEVDEERQGWLNSFYRSPLRIPMPAELEYWWSQDHRPEFVILNKEPEPDSEDPSKLVYTEDPLILHTKTGRLINFVEDEEHGIRLFWQPPLEEGEDVDPKKAEFLPLGFDEFYGETDGTENKGGILNQFITAVGNACNPVLDKVDKWVEEKRKASEMKLQLIEKELEVIEAELCLEEALEDMEAELEMKQKEEEKRVELEEKNEKNTSSARSDQDGTDLAEEAEVEEEDDEEDDGAPSSFGSVTTDQDLKSDKGKKPGKSPFATTSLSFAPGNMISTVPSKLQESFLTWKNRKCGTPNTSAPRVNIVAHSVSFTRQPVRQVSLKAAGHKQLTPHQKRGRPSQLYSLSRILSMSESSTRQGRPISKHKSQGRDQTRETHCHSILSMHVPIRSFENNLVN